jgi:hypothetical protein
MNQKSSLREVPQFVSKALTANTKDVTITSVPHTDLPFCSKEPPNIWKLVDGFPVAWNIYLDK